MLLAWPNAETFKGGIKKLAPTIKLWTASTMDVDYWTGQQAIIRLCQSCKFPPTIAEFREQAMKVSREIQALIDKTIQDIRSADYTYGSPSALYAALPSDSFTRTVIDIVGGPDALTVTFDQNGKQSSMWNIAAIRAACHAAVQNQPSRIGGGLLALPVKASGKDE